MRYQGASQSGVIFSKIRMLPAQIFMVSTYPLGVVLAHRRGKQNEDLKNDALTTDLILQCFPQFLLQPLLGAY
jgi:hypothetical protein